MNNIELYKNARNRVQNKLGKGISDRDIIIDQEEEIIYYREKIKKLTDMLKYKKDIELNKKNEIDINKEDYLIMYNEDTDMIILNTYLIKLINEEDIDYIISKENEFKIINKSRCKRDGIIILDGE